MTNETTASQPKSIGEDNKFISLMNEWDQATHERSDEVFDRIADYVHEYFRAPADQASATIQAAPIGYIAAYELGRLNSGHDAILRSAKFGPSPLDGDVPVYLSPKQAATIQEPVRAAEPVCRIKQLELLVDAYGPKSLQYDIEHPNDGLNSGDPVEVENVQRGRAAPMVADPAGVVGCPSDGWPDEIYLNAGEGPLSNFSEYAEVDWCDHPQGENDVRYIRAELCDTGVVLLSTINRNLGKRLSAALAASMVADPAGLSDIPHGVYFSASENNFYDAGTKVGMGCDFFMEWRDCRAMFPQSPEAATVKAVPSEALALAFSREDWGIIFDGVMLEIERSQKRKEANTASNSDERVEQGKSILAAICKVCAAPLADKTGGGE